jgi:hypothetical protein
MEDANGGIYLLEEKFLSIGKNKKEVGDYEG